MNGTSRVFCHGYLGNWQLYQGIWKDLNNCIVLSIGIMTALMNPVDWYETLLPHTMMKVEKLTVLKYADADQMRERYINRRRDDEYRVRGAMIQKSVEKDGKMQLAEYTLADIQKRDFSQPIRSFASDDRVSLPSQTIVTYQKEKLILTNGTKLDRWEIRNNPSYEIQPRKK